MKQYVIDELRPGDHEKIKAFFDEEFGFSGMDGIYWLPVDPEILNDVQVVHSECKPFYFAVEIDTERLACELLIRTKNRMKCDCISYADTRQRSWIIEAVDAIFEKLEIIT